MASFRSRYNADAVTTAIINHIILHHFWWTWVTVAIAKKLQVISSPLTNKKSWLTGKGVRTEWDIPKRKVWPCRSGTWSFAEMRRSWGCWVPTCYVKLWRSGMIGIIQRKVTCVSVASVSPFRMFASRGSPHSHWGSTIFSNSRTYQIRIFGIFQITAAMVTTSLEVGHVVAASWAPPPSRGKHWDLPGSTDLTVEISLKHSTSNVPKFKLNVTVTWLGCSSLCRD